MYREGFPYLGEELAVNARLPGAGQRWLRHGAVLGGYACLAALAVALGPADGRGLAGVVAAAAAVVLFLVRRALGRFMAWALCQPSWGFEAVEAPGLRAALASAGLRRVTVVTAMAGQRAAGRRGLSCRSGRAGVIFLPAYLKDPEGVIPEVARQIAAHEATHLARDDSMTSDLLGAGRLCLLLAVALTAPASLSWLLPALVILHVAFRWHVELACDRIAVQEVGPVTARAYVGYNSEMVERARSRPLARRLIWQARSKFTHPPWRMRRNAFTAAIAAQEQASPRTST